MAKSIYTEIFTFYHVINKDDTTKRAMRKVIRTRLKPRIWENLTDIEKAEFKLVTMKDYLLEFTPEHHKTEVKKNIENELKALLLQANKDLKSHNDEVELLYREFYNKDASDEDNFNSYKELCELLPKHVPTAIIPTFEEWKENKFRLYDFRQNEIYNHNQSSDSQDYLDGFVTQKEIDHYVIECLRKIIEDKYRIIIDVDNIRHCLEVTYGIDIENEKLQAEVDKASPIPVEEQKQSIYNNLNIMDSFKKLKTLDFIINK